MATSLGPLRRPAVAGTWYPGTAEALGRDVDRYLAAVDQVPHGEITALIAPHAGLMYSGPVAAHAYRAVAGRSYAVVVLVGPSHFAGFDGVAVYERGAFATPFGPVPVAEAHAEAIRRATPLVFADPTVHGREHSLEMQLPFLCRVLPGIPIVPLVMGFQTRRTIHALAAALAGALGGEAALLVASTDLSHYLDGPTAASYDGHVVDCIRRFDAEAFLARFEEFPEDERGRYVACGGGPAIAVMLAARALGAADARVLKHADSGDVSGDKRAVVGYVAAVMGRLNEPS